MGSCRKCGKWIKPEYNYCYECYSKKKGILKKDEPIRKSDVKKYTYKGTRQEYSSAYKYWTKKDDELLRDEFKEGSSIEELSNILDRTPGAIRSRLIKLGLIETKIE